MVKKGKQRRNKCAEGLGKGRKQANEWGGGREEK